MTVAIVGSRGLNADIPENVIDKGATHIISGGAIGVDRSARRYAAKHRILITEILPEYDLYGRAAPIERNKIIINKSDLVYIFWDGKSRGSVFVINECKRQNKPYAVYLWCNGEFVLHNI